MRHDPIELLTPARAAQIAGVTPQAIIRAIHEGRLRAIPIGCGRKRQRWLISSYELSLYEPNRDPRGSLGRWRGQGFGPKRERHDL